MQQLRKENQLLKSYIDTLEKQNISKNKQRQLLLKQIDRLMQENQPKSKESTSYNKNQIYELKSQIKQLYEKINSIKNHYELEIQKKNMLIQLQQKSSLQQKKQRLQIQQIKNIQILRLKELINTITMDKQRLSNELTHLQKQHKQSLTIINNPNIDKQMLIRQYENKIPIFCSFNIQSQHHQNHNNEIPQQQKQSTISIQNQLNQQLQSMTIKMQQSISRIQELQLQIQMKDKQIEMLNMIKQHLTSSNKQNNITPQAIYQKIQHVEKNYSNMYLEQLNQEVLRQTQNQVSEYQLTIEIKQKEIETLKMMNDYLRSQNEQKDFVIKCFEQKLNQSDNLAKDKQQYKQLKQQLRNKEQIDDKEYQQNNIQIEIIQQQNIQIKQELKMRNIELQEMKRIIEKYQKQKRIKLHQTNDINQQFQRKSHQLKNIIFIKDNQLVDSYKNLQIKSNQLIKQQQVLSKIVAQLQQLQELYSTTNQQLQVYIVKCDNMQQLFNQQIKAKDQKLLQLVNTNEQYEEKLKQINLTQQIIKNSELKQVTINLQQTHQQQINSKQQQAENQVKEYQLTIEIKQKEIETLKMMNAYLRSQNEQKDFVIKCFQQKIDKNNQLIKKLQSDKEIKQPLVNNENNQQIDNKFARTISENIQLNQQINLQNIKLQKLTIIIQQLQKQKSIIKEQLKQTNQSFQKKCNQFNHFIQVNQNHCIDNQNKIIIQSKQFTYQSENLQKTKKQLQILQELYSTMINKLNELQAELQLRQIQISTKDKQLQSYLAKIANTQQLFNQQLKKKDQNIQQLTKINKQYENKLKQQQQQFEQLQTVLQTKLQNVNELIAFNNNNNNLSQTNNSSKQLNTLQKQLKINKNELTQCIKIIETLHEQNKQLKQIIESMNQQIENNNQYKSSSQYYGLKETQNIHEEQYNNYDYNVNQYRNLDKRGLTKFGYKDFFDEMQNYGKIPFESLTMGEQFMGRKINRNSYYEYNDHLEYNHPSYNVMATNNRYYNQPKLQQHQYPTFNKTNLYYQNQQQRNSIKSGSNKKIKKTSNK